VCKADYNDPDVEAVLREISKLLLI